MSKQPNTIDDTRQRWDGETTFLWSTTGLCIGFGNLLSFPYYCAKWGGFAVFGVPYLIFLCLVGIPLIILELGLG